MKSTVPPLGVETAAATAVRSLVPHQLAEAFTAPAPRFATPKLPATKPRLLSVTPIAFTPAA